MMALPACAVRGPICDSDKRQWPGGETKLLKFSSLDVLSIAHEQFETKQYLGQSSKCVYDGKPMCHSAALGHYRTQIRIPPLG